MARLSWAFYVGWILSATNLTVGQFEIYVLGFSKVLSSISFFIRTPATLLGVTALAWYLDDYILSNVFTIFLSAGWALIGATQKTYACLNGLSGYDC